MRKLQVIISSIGMLLLLLGGCKKQDVFFAERGEAQFVGDSVYVPDAKIYVMGQVYEESAHIEKGHIALVELDGHSYFIYNDGDTLIELTDEASALALYKRMIKYYEHVQFSAQANVLSAPVIDFGRCSWWGDEEYEYVLKTGIGMTSLGNGYYRFTNCKIRTAMVESGDNFVYLLPRNFIDGTEADLQVSNIVKSYGAISRPLLTPGGAAIFVADTSFVRSVLDAYNSNPEGFIKLNFLDLWIAFDEIIHEIFGIAVPVCGEFVWDGIAVPMEALVLAIASEDAQGANALAIEIASRVTEDMLTCAASGVTEALNKILNLLNLLNLIESSFGYFDVATTLAYDHMVLDTFVFRFTLTWGEEPRDLDSHLWTPSINGTSYHVYYGYKGNRESPPYAELDVDDITSFGPENLTIYRTFSGTYIYAVHHYCYWSDDSSDIAHSNARVLIYDGSGNVLYTLHVPQADSVGRCWWWHVAAIDGETGEIEIINQLSPDPPVPGISSLPDKRK